jgi:hypothetical protein
MLPTGPIRLVLQPEEIAAAPPEVRRWLDALLAPEAGAEVLQRNGFRYADGDLAVLQPFEVSGILERIAGDELACQVLFRLGCEFYDPATGLHRPYAISVADFVHSTDIENGSRLPDVLGRINAALREIRRDPNASIYAIDKSGAYCVHETTQCHIYRQWVALVGQAQPLTAVSAA